MIYRIIHLLPRISFGLREVVPRRRTILHPWFFFCVKGVALPLHGRDHEVEDVAHLMFIVELPLNLAERLVHHVEDWLDDLLGIGLVVRLRAGNRVGTGVYVRSWVVGFVAVVVNLVSGGGCSSHVRVGG